MITNTKVILPRAGSEIVASQSNYSTNLGNNFNMRAERRDLDTAPLLIWPDYSASHGSPPPHRRFCQDSAWGGFEGKNGGYAKVTLGTKL